MKKRCRLKKSISKSSKNGLKIKKIAKISMKMTKRRAKIPRLYFWFDKQPKYFFSDKRYIFLSEDYFL